MMGPRSMGMGAGTQWDGLTRLPSSSFFPLSSSIAITGGPRGEGPSRQRTYDEYPSDTRETKLPLTLTPAQRLIERYERMSTPPLLPPQTPPGSGSGAVGYTTGQVMRAKSTRSRQYVYDYRKEAAVFDDDGGAGNDKRGRGLGNLKKDRSPIRQSLKNLFSVLKKGAGGLAKRSHGLHHHHHHNGKGEESLVVPGHGGVVLANNEVGLKTNDHERCDAQNLNNAAPVSVPPLHHLNRPPRKKMTGPLLYLSRQSPLCNADADSSSEDIPNIPAPRAASGPNGLDSQTESESESSSWAWSTCSVTLEEGKLVVSCFTGDLELYVHEIALVRCVDIRSLSTAQLKAGVKEEGMVVVDLSEDKEREMKVFEMTFADGRGKERFAAKSVRERAGWISAIWDAILPSQDIHEQPEPTPGEGNDRSLGPSKQDNVDSRRLPVESPTPTPLPKMSSLLSHSQHSPPSPPLPSKSHNNATTGIQASLNLPTIAPLVPHKKPPDLHLDLSEFAGPISPPSIYPPTVTPGASQNEVVISPSIYGQAQQERLGQPSSSSRPASIFVASPVSLVSPGSGSGSAPNSPSIRNLSQLSVVRQRLAQIQRNHSEISGESRYSYSAASHPHSPAAAVVGSPTSSAHLRAHGRGVGGGGGGTPLASPISPAGSGWSKSEAVFYRKGKARSTGDDDSAHRNSTASPRSDRTIIDEKRKEGQEVGQRKVSNNKTRPRANSHRDQGHGPAVAPPISPGKTTTGPSKDDIRRLSKEVNGIKNVLGGESGCSTVHEMVFSLEQRMRGEKKDLRAIKDELKVLGDRVSEAIATNVDVAARIEAVNANAQAVANAAVRRHPTSPPTNETSRKDDQTIIQALNEVKDRLSVEFPALAGKIQDIKDAQKKEKEIEKKNKIVTMNNIGRSSSLPSNSDPDDSSRAVADQKLLLEKLEEIRSLCQALTSTVVAPPSVPAPIAAPIKGKEESVDLKENLDKILTLIQEESNKQTLLSQQQGDSVRYLNELNSWLEAFVNNGTSQIQGISNNIERLCNEIGCSPSNGNGRPSSRNQGSQPNLVNDIRQLVAGMKARDQNFTALQAAVHSLLEVLTASQAQQGADSQAIAGLMDRQRHDQEAMFRAFTNEISGEIKGERLRFVDAMKEATAINVQLHVEQFKQELSREVMAMTEEVGRLHREKQIVENQISDLFSFYSKHKKAEMPLQVIPPNTGVPSRNNVQEAPRAANIPRSNRQRALPAYPRQQ